MHDRAPVYLLGAGASCEAGIPLAREITARMLDLLNSRGYADAHARGLNYVVAAMIAHKSRDGSRPDVLPDIESLVSAVELLANRDDLEITPFVRDWDSTISTLGVERRPRPSGFWARDLREGILGRSGAFADGKIADALTTFLNSANSYTGDRLFQGLHDELFRRLGELLEIKDPRSTDYLRPLVEMGNQPGGVTIATLNYDLGLEIAGSEAGLAVSRGIDSWTDAWTLTWPTDQVRVIKLHGSIDWKRETVFARDGEMRLSVEGLAVTAKGERLPQRPFVIYGRREKLRPVGPFLELRSAFIEELKRARLLVVIGYSFMDAHVNELIRHWLNSNLARRIIVVDPFFPTDSRWSFPDDFRGVLVSGLQRKEPVIVGDRRVESVAESRIRVLREPASSAFRQICNAEEEILRRFFGR